MGNLTFSKSIYFRPHTLGGQLSLAPVVGRKLPKAVLAALHLFTSADLDIVITTSRYLPLLEWVDAASKTKIDHLYGWIHYECLPLC